MSTVMALTKWYVIEGKDKAYIRLEIILDVLLDVLLMPISIDNVINNETEGYVFLKFFCIFTSHRNSYYWFK